MDKGQVTKQVQMVSHLLKLDDTVHNFLIEDDKWRQLPSRAYNSYHILKSYNCIEDGCIEKEKKKNYYKIYVRW